MKVYQLVVCMSAVDLKRQMDRDNLIHKGSTRSYAKRNIRTNDGRVIEYALINKGIESFTDKHPTEFVFTSTALEHANVDFIKNIINVLRKNRHEDAQKFLESREWEK